MGYVRWVLLTVVLTSGLVGGSMWVWTGGVPGTGAVLAVSFGLSALLGAGIGQYAREQRGDHVRMLLDDLDRQNGLLPPELEAMRNWARRQRDDSESRLERVRSRAELAERIADQGSEGVLTVGNDGRMLRANPAFDRLLNARGAPGGRQPIEVYPLAELQVLVDAARQGLATEPVHSAVGDRDLVLRARRLDSGRVLVLVADETSLREAERSRSNFVANVSHELRTPIAAIMGYAETLQQDTDRLPEDLVRLVTALERNAKRLRDLFEDLLKLHRIETRRRELPREPQRLLGILADAVVPAAELAADRDQAFELDCHEELVARVNAEALATIVTNLAINATNYTQSGGSVTVSAGTLDDEGAFVAVRDTGVGIETIHLDRIFERFYRVDEARSREVGGTGLGLAIVKHLALASGCTVAVRSELGEGTVFRVEIPA